MNNSRVLSLRAGAIDTITWRGRPLPTAIRKAAADGPLMAREDGLEGDEQADLEHHGGREKALCAYPSEHYPYWSRRLGRLLAAGAFGENLTLSGLTEAEACIGDTYRLGAAILQISQPRQPCFKLGALYEVDRLPLWIQETGWTGFYLRVLSPGLVAAGDRVSLEGQPHPELTVLEANRIMHRDRTDRAAIQRLLVPELSSSWTDRLQRRLEGSICDDRPRLSGPADES